jgi:integrase
MRRSNLSDDLITITQKLMMARERSEVMNLASEYTALIERAMQLEQQGSIAAIQQHTRSVTAIIKFTYKEIQMMSFTFKKEFIANGLAAHVIKKESGRNSYCYEIRYRSNGYNIIASSTDLREAKRKFLAKTVPGEIEKYRIKKSKTGINLLEEVFDEWYMVKKGTITEGELKKHYSNFCALPETLRKKPILSVRTGDLDKILKDVKPRKYEDLRTLFNGIFKYAIASGIIQNNPVALIPFKRAERQSRDALPEEEIYSFLKRVELPEFEPIRQGAYLLYFFGLRPCEVDQETHREDDFLIARNRKRKNGKIEYKKIPVPREAQGLIDWDKPLIFNCTRITRDRLFKKLLGDGERTAYCLRHTFSTVCQEYLKRPDIVDIWMGDSPQRLVGRVYTHFSDKFMRAQMDMVAFPTLENRIK